MLQDIGSNGNGWELRPVTDFASNDIVDEQESNRKSPVKRRAPKPFPFYTTITLEVNNDLSALNMQSDCQ